MASVAGRRGTLNTTVSFLPGHATVPNWPHNQLLRNHLLSFQSTTATLGIAGIAGLAAAGDV